DTQDIFQNVFLKYALSSVAFEGEEHEKAWLIRVATNACKDLLRDFFRKNTVPLERISEYGEEEKTENWEVLEAVLSLPSKYKNVVYLHYYEGYTAGEISKILGKNVNTVYTYLNRARKLLAEKLGGDRSE
ncbi:MAG: sigma-70 family RNA polymerase sigma factor, partial [Eubacteriales bacterium]|nr:sigma-70 family RNA polymerase sigma factor [Eubacteriales bacterium]